MVQGIALCVTYLPGLSVTYLAGSNQATSEGTGFVLNVNATGTAPLTYQWRKGGVAISGATSASFSVASAMSADAGSYTVVVTNGAGSATSNAATITTFTGAAAATHTVAGAGYTAGGIVTITHSAISAPDLAARIKAGGVNVSLSTPDYSRIDFDGHGVEGLVRISPHAYNTHDEIDTLVTIVGSLT